MPYWPFKTALLLGFLYYLATYISQPSPDLKPKIFVLGLSKTGTTSIGNALALLGYKRLGWKDIKSRHLVSSYLHGETEALLWQTQHYDAFEDLPWPFVYREVAERWPDAKFVLSLRRDEETWVRSLRRHLGRGPWAPAKAIYGADSVEGNEEVVLEVYRNHSAAVREYFADKPEKLVEIVIDDRDGNWEKLCEVARCPADKMKGMDFPKSNTASSWHDGEMGARMHRKLIDTISIMEEALGEVYYGMRIPLVNLVLDGVWRVIDAFELASVEMWFRFGQLRG